MSSEWIDFNLGFSVAGEGAFDAAQLVFTNNEQPARPRTVVDGYLTVITDTDNLCQVRMYGPCQSFAASGDFSLNVPARAEEINWYRLNCGRGPMVFRIRSKRTFEPEEELWVAGVKWRGTTSTNVLVACELLLSG